MLFILHFFKLSIYMFNKYIDNNVTLVAIIIFLSIYVIVNLTKPSFLYKKDGTLREFGIGYKEKTIIPVWLLSILLAILSYVFVLVVSSNN